MTVSLFDVDGKYMGPSPHWFKLTETVGRYVEIVYAPPIPLNWTDKAVDGMLEIKSIKLLKGYRGKTPKYRFADPQSQAIFEEIKREEESWP